MPGGQGVWLRMSNTAAAMVVLPERAEGSFVFGNAHLIQEGYIHSGPAANRLHPHGLMAILPDARVVPAVVRVLMG